MEVCFVVVSSQTALRIDATRWTTDELWKADVDDRACSSPEAEFHFLKVLPSAPGSMIDVGSDLRAWAGELHEGKPAGANRSTNADRTATIDRLADNASRRAFRFLPLCSNRFCGAASVRILYLLWHQHRWWTLRIRQKDTGAAVYPYAGQA